ncbi:unnamed protein product [Diamesa serratosioi]
MKWFNGGISEAIQQAKDKIFVVFIEGDDTSSQDLSLLIDAKKISEKLESQQFVAIKIKSDTPEYFNFAKIYQLVPVPSLFFIQNGIPIKIVTSVVTTETEMDESITTVLGSANSPQPSSSQQTTTTAGSSDIVCEDGVCYKKEKSVQESEKEKEEMLKKAMKIVEQKRIERIQEEKKVERERELRRRKEGQAVVDLKKQKDDQDMKNIMDERKKEKSEADAARARVKSLIAADKAERAAKFGASVESNPPSPDSPVLSSPIVEMPPPNSARIQFRKPDGENQSHIFEAKSLFSDLHKFVKSTVLVGCNVKEFTLATTFPRREFTQADFVKTLLELELAPSSVLLIIPGKKTSFIPAAPSSMSQTSGGGLTAMVQSLFMTLVYGPMIALYSYIKNMITNAREGAGVDKRNEDILTPNDAAKKRNLDRFDNRAGTSSQASGNTSTGQSSTMGAKPKTTAYKRPSNIHRLRQNSDDSEDEEKTYNGNSTQQL